ncbi:MAG TPA: hypothetical protein VFO65_12095 [Acidimicrobiales bacterium]|nr:hypothetical protein [Acidimicrobiales bacterium]
MSRAAAPAPGAVTGRSEAVRRLLAWVALLAGTLALLYSPAAGGLAPPPVTAGADALRRWLDGRDAATALFSVVRLVVIVMAWYLLGTLLVSLALRLGRAGRAAAAVDLVTLPPIRRLVQAAAGLTLAASALTLTGAGGGADGGSVAAASAPAAGPRSPVMQRVAGPGDVVMQRVAGGDDVVMRRVADPGEETGVVMEGLPAGLPPGTAAVGTMAAGGPAAPAQWTVRPGDHLWRVAEEVLATAWTRPPSDSETTPYWARLVEVNRSNLADPANPDLLFPGQVLEVPPPPPPPSPAG